MDVDLADLDAVAAALDGVAVITILTQVLPVKSTSVCARVRTWRFRSPGGPEVVQAPSAPLVESAETSKE